MTSGGMLGTMMQRLGENLPQIEIRWLGGIKTILGRLTFYRGMLTFAMLIPVAYHNSPILQGLFPNVIAFAGGMVLILGIAAVVEYGLIYPSQILFNKRQQSKNGRDPIYQKTESIEATQEEILAKLDEMED